MKRRNVMLDDRTVKILAKLGGGNISEGIRRAAAFLDDSPEALRSDIL